MNSVHSLVTIYVASFHVSHSDAYLFFWSLNAYNLSWSWYFSTAIKKINEYKAAIQRGPSGSQLQTISSVASGSGYPPKLHNGSLLLIILHAVVVEHREIKKKMR